eukprot:scaffold1576_cov192-Alexandrium_tamarense.AAC.5
MAARSACSTPTLRRLFCPRCGYILLRLEEPLANNYYKHYYIIVSSQPGQITIYSPFPPRSQFQSIPRLDDELSMKISHLIVAVVASQTTVDATLTIAAADSSTGQIGASGTSCVNASLYNAVYQR